jgi:hypothetical protein
MATVTNNLTRIHDAEGALTANNVPSGGGGATANTDIFLQGAQSLGRRQTTTGAAAGFCLQDAADNDCSAASVHVGFWVWVTHYGLLDDLRIIFSSGTGTPTNFDSHNFPFATEFPKTGGWLRVWVDVSRTPDTVGGTGLNEAALRQYGAQLSFTGTPGGSADNFIIDVADFTDGTDALSLTGTGGVWTDFTTADENTSNQYGVMRKINGVFVCYARVQLGTASSLVFSDSSFSIVFPQQNLVENSFMGINIDLQHASTNIDWASAFIGSAGTKQGDLIVTGTSGTFDVTNTTLAALRIITLTSQCVITGCILSACGQITQGGATITDCSIINNTAASNVISTITTVESITNTLFQSDGTGHAIEITGTAANISLTNLDFSGYAAVDGSTGNEAIYINIATGSMDLVVDGGTTPSIRTAGCAVTVISGAVTVEVTVKDGEGANIENARVLLTADAGGPFPSNVTVTIANSGTTATVTHGTHGMATNDKVMISGASHNANNGVFSITKIDANSYSYTMGSTPGSNPTGTIKAWFVALYGLTNASGYLSASRVYNSDQPVSGRVRKSTTAPFYRSFNLTGTVDSVTGFSTTLQLILDQ